ncbi:MAG: prepilin peptidase [Pseudomonadota bacterium]
MLANTAVLFLGFMMLLAAWTDVRGYTIPNWIPGLLAAVWPAGALAMGLSWAEAGVSLAVGFVALAVMVGMWLMRWMGGGDAKLIAAGALWFSWPDAMGFILMSAVAGGILALLLVLARRFVPALPFGGDWMRAGPLAPGAPAPYAVAIAAGALWVLPSSHLALRMVA